MSPSEYRRFRSKVSRALFSLGYGWVIDADHVANEIALTNPTPRELKNVRLLVMRYVHQRFRKIS